MLGSSSKEVIISGFLLVKDKVKKLELQKEGRKKKSHKLHYHVGFFFFYLALPAASFCIELLWQSDTLTHFWYLHIGCDGTLHEKKKPVAHFTPVCGASERIRRRRALTRANTKTTRPRVRAQR